MTALCSSNKPVINCWALAGCIQQRQWEVNCVSLGSSPHLGRWISSRRRALHFFFPLGVWTRLYETWGIRSEWSDLGRAGPAPGRARAPRRADGGRGRARRAGRGRSEPGNGGRGGACPFPSLRRSRPRRPCLLVEKRKKQSNKSSKRGAASFPSPSLDLLFSSPQAAEAFQAKQKHSNWCYFSSTLIGFFPLHTGALLKAQPAKLPQQPGHQREPRKRLFSCTDYIQSLRIEECGQPEFWNARIFEFSHEFKELSVQLKAVGVEEWPRTPSRPEDVQQRRVEGMKALAVINAGKLTQKNGGGKKNASVQKVKY